MKLSYRFVVGVVASCIYGGTLSLADSQTGESSGIRAEHAKSGHNEGPRVALIARCHEPDRVTLTFRNVGNEDTAILLGSILANGRKYMVDGLRLRVKPADGPEVNYEYLPRDYPAVIGGRIDEWVVTLPVAASYVMQVEPAHFHLEDWTRSTQISFRLSLRAPNPNQLAQGWLHASRVYGGTGELFSNAFVVPDECGV
jgi:hypothetical protein